MSRTELMRIKALLELFEMTAEVRLALASIDWQLEILDQVNGIYERVKR